MTDDKALAGRLRHCREYLGYSQQQVADHLGLHRPAVSEIEAGRRKVDALELARLAKLYGRPLGYFLGEPGSPPGPSLVELVTPLAPEDRAELLLFAEFLSWRKRARPEPNPTGDPPCGNATN